MSSNYTQPNSDSTQTDTTQITRDFGRDIKIILLSTLAVIVGELFSVLSGRSILEATLEIQSVLSTTDWSTIDGLTFLGVLSTQVFVVLLFLTGILFVFTTGFAILSLILSYIPSDSVAIKNFVALRRTSIVVLVCQVLIYASIV